MKKRLAPLILAVPLLLAGCSGNGIQYEGAPEQQAADACADAVSEFAQDPVETELMTPVEASLDESSGDQLPEGTAFRSVNFGDVRFITGTGAPDIYTYGCITYHDQNKQVIDAKADVVDDEEVSQFGYSYMCDRFIYEKTSVDDRPDTAADC